MLAGSGWNSASSQHNLYDIYLLLCVQCETPDDGQRNGPKHVEFYSKNKFEKLVHLVGFIIRIKAVSTLPMRPHSDDRGKLNTTFTKGCRKVDVVLNPQARKVYMEESECLLSKWKSG